MTRAVLIGLGLGLLAFGLTGARAKEPTLPSWQLVGVHAACFGAGEQMVLRLNDGASINTVAKLKVVHVDLTRNVVTFGERP